MIRWLKSYISGQTTVDSFPMDQSPDRNPAQHKDSVYEAWSDKSVWLTYEDPKVSPKNIKYNKPGDQDYNLWEQQDKPWKGQEEEPGWHREPKRLKGHDKTPFQPTDIGPTKQKNPAIDELKKRFKLNNMNTKAKGWLKTAKDEIIDEDPRLGSILTSDLHASLSGILDKFLKSGAINETESIEISKSVGEVLQFMRELIAPEVYNRRIEFNKIEEINDGIMDKS